MKKILLILLIIVLVIVASGNYYLFNGLSELKANKIAGVDIDQLQDGQYTGSFDYYRWSNQLVVTIAQGKISAIEIVDDVDIPQDQYTKALFKRVIDEQRLTVDVVAGATATSKAYLMSMHQALSNGK